MLEYDKPQADLVWGSENIADLTTFLKGRLVRSIASATFSGSKSRPTCYFVIESDPLYVSE